MDRPWMTALEMQFVALRNAKVMATAPEFSDSTISIAPQLLRQAEAYAWTSETATAAWLAAKSLPQTLVLPAITGQKISWWWFEGPLPVSTTSKGSPVVALCTYAHDLVPTLTMEGSTTPASPGVEIIAFVRKDHGPLPCLAWRWRCGESLAEMLGRNHDVLAHGRQPVWDQRPMDVIQSASRAGMEQISRLFFAATAWLQQRIVSLSMGGIQRQRRKQLMREHNLPVLSDVKVVQLRRQESTPHEPRPDSEPVDWSCRWVVGGHWRNQYHPSDGRHELLYVLPYVKGPADKPLRLPTHTVYAVNR